MNKLELITAEQARSLTEEFMHNPEIVSPNLIKKINEEILESSAMGKSEVEIFISRSDGESVSKMLINNGFDCWVMWNSLKIRWS